MRRRCPDILWPSECLDVHSVGGKAASLGKLVDAWPIPPFFCLTVAGATIWRDDVGKAPLRAAYGTLMAGAPGAVAVRSSATGEDGERASFAGQYESVFDVVDFPSLVDAIECCLHSAGSARATTYAKGRKEVEATPMAVIVQRQVRADASAVAFSADPTSGDRHSIVINGAWGMGEGIVGGSLTPDTFLVGRHDGTISAALGEKSEMVVATGTGLARVPVPEALRRYPALTLRQVERIAEMTEDLEKRLGRPVDVECCVEGDALHLLQCRPITTLEEGRAP